MSDLIGKTGSMIGIDESKDNADTEKYIEMELDSENPTLTIAQCC